MNKVLIVIPAYNEEANIENVVREELMQKRLSISVYHWHVLS